MSDASDAKNLIPPDQVEGIGNRAISAFLMDRLSDRGREVVADFISGRPYRGASTGRLADARM